MSNYEILKELKELQNTVSKANARIADLLKQLEGASSDEWDWISVKKASEFLDVSIGKIYENIKNKKIQCRVICGKKFVRQRELEAL